MSNRQLWGRKAILELLLLQNINSDSSGEQFVEHVYATELK